MLAFLSDRAKADILQLYVMPTNGGEAQKLTDAKAGVSDFAWSPDGLRIAYLAADAKTEDEEKREKERDDAIQVDHDAQVHPTLGRGRGRWRSTGDHPARLPGARLRVVPRWLGHRHQSNP